MADLPPNIKDAIFDRIGEGKLKPEEGEVELRRQLREWLNAGGHLAGKSPAEVEQAIDRLGVAPLNQPVDASLFDPMSQSRWTLAMAIAWIMWRDKDKVRDCSNDYWTAHFDWVDLAKQRKGDGNQQIGWSLQQRKPTSLHNLRLDEAANFFKESERAKMVMSIQQAREALWQALQNKSLIGEAVDLSDKVIQIPSRDWAHLEPIFVSEADALRYVFKPLDIAYRKINFRRKQLLKEWQENPRLPGAHSEILERPTSEREHQTIQDTPDPDKGNKRHFDHKQPATNTPRRRITAPAAKRLPDTVRKIYEEKPHFTRPELWAHAEAKLNVTIPQSIRRKVEKEVPARGRPGRKPLK